MADVAAHAARGNKEAIAVLGDWLEEKMGRRPDGFELRRIVTGELPKIVSYFRRVTPVDEDVEMDEETGVEDEETIEPDFDEGETFVSVAVKYLRRKWVAEASSTNFHIGVWYQTNFETIDYRTGEEESLSFHLKGFSPKEEREIFDEVAPRWGQIRRTKGKRR
jgi:hypothetical protein